VGYGDSKYCESSVYENRVTDPPILRDSYFASLTGQANINIDIFFLIKLQLYLRYRIVFVHQGDWRGTLNDNGFQYYIEIKLGIDLDLTIFQFADEFNAAPGSEDDDTPDCGIPRRYYVRTKVDDKHHLMQQMPGSFRGKKARTPGACTERMACIGWDFDPSNPNASSMAPEGERPAHCQYGSPQPQCGPDFGRMSDRGGDSVWQNCLEGNGCSERPKCKNTCYRGYINDGDCDDGGAGAEYNVCALGTDCDDCGGSYWG